MTSLRGEYIYYTVSHPLKYFAVGALRSQFINLASSPQARENLLISKGQRPGTRKAEESNIAHYF